MDKNFNSADFLLARNLKRLSLEDIANKVSKSKQYLSDIERKRAIPNEMLVDSLARILEVKKDFLISPPKEILKESEIHFRKRATTPKYIKEEALAYGEFFKRLVIYLDSKVKLPTVNIPNNISGLVDIEKIADFCRDNWGIGSGPISNMTRLAEHIGIVVTSFSPISDKIDAFSFYNYKRPIIIRSNIKDSICRQRFDIAHELGHLILHSDIETGDDLTEEQANHFASAFLLPRSIMVSFFPRIQPYDSRMNWKGISEFKKIWRVSKAAILYRAYQLNLLSLSQYKSAFISLKKKEAIKEIEDDFIKNENPESPELLQIACNVLATKKAIYAEDIAKDLQVELDFLNFLVEGDILIRRPQKKLYLVSSSNVA